MIQKEQAAITFIVHALPVAQPRQRHRVITAHGRTFAHNYTPTKHPVNAFKAAVQVAALTVYHGPPLMGPLGIDVLFVMPRPRALMWKTRPMPRVWHIGRPDTENMFKALADALTGTLWKDDAQLCDVTISKMISSGDEQPHVKVEVELLT